MPSLKIASPFLEHVKTQIFRALYTIFIVWLIERGAAKGTSFDSSILAIFPIVFLFFIFRPHSGHVDEGWPWLITIMIITLPWHEDIVRLGVLRAWIAFSYIGVGFTALPPLDSWTDPYFELPEYEVVRECGGLLTFALLLATAGKAYDYVNFAIYGSGSIAMYLALFTLFSVSRNTIAFWRGKPTKPLLRLLPPSLRRRASLIHTRIPLVLSHSFMRFLAAVEHPFLQRRTAHCASLPKFIYPNTSLDSSSIRLLIVDRRVFGQPPSCHLSTVPLTDAPPYVACSYVWGSSTNTAVILVDGQPFEVSESLYAVVRRQQSFVRCSTLWIDAICIDQFNDVEKAAQIAIMRHIFQMATQVRAFVQPGLMPMMQSSMLYLLSDDDAYTANAKKVRIRDETDRHSCSKQFTEFLEKAWFVRVWILQEAAVPENLRIIYADAEFDWDHFIRRLSENQGAMALAGVLSRPACSGSGRDSADSGIEVQAIQDFAFARALQQIQFLAWTRREFHRNGYVPLYGLLLSSARYQATKSHDRIFALLGLTTLDAADRIGIDYSMDLGELYIRTMEYIVRQQDDISFITMSNGTESIRGQDLPSWVSSWKIMDPTRFQSPGTHRQWNAATKLPFEACEMLRDGRSLKVKTLQIDTVGRTEIKIPTIDNAESYLQPATTPMPRPKILTPGKDFVVQAWQLAKWGTSFSATHLSADSALSVTALREAFYQTLLMDPTSAPLPHPAPSTSVPQPSSEALFADFEWAVDLYSDTQAAPFLTFEDQRFPDGDQLVSRFAHAERFAAQVFTGAVDRSFAVTKQGRLAMLPVAAREGDELHLIPSGEAAFVLRPAGLIESEGLEREYRLVGYAYVSGAMDGQLVGDLDAYTVAKII